MVEDCQVKRNHLGVSIREPSVNLLPELKGYVECNHRDCYKLSGLNRFPDKSQPCRCAYGICSPALPQDIPKSQPRKLKKDHYLPWPTIKTTV